MNQRLFAALELPTSVLASLAEVIKRLRADLPPASVRWVRPEAIHLTVRFYGATPPERLSALQASLFKAASGLDAIELELDRLGVFPNAVAPRVIWVGLKGMLEALETLNSQLETQARAVGFRAEIRPFTPHLTLGRVNRLRAPDKQKLSQLIKETALNAVGPFTLDHVSLIKSELKPTGAVYTRLLSAPLNESHSSVS
jgi:RNA 2',3'-cyclic 3'-phosphodiesterase